MKILASVEELLIYRKSLQGSVGFVPTMGALHEGHLSLMRQSMGENDHTIVSIFVNPTQFLAGEDLSKYPRKIEADTKICELAGVSALFLPTPAMMYGDDEVLIKAPSKRGYIFEGFIRPGHFDGVLQVVLKLFGLTRPQRAYFGKKDTQQLALITQMVKNFFLPVEIIAGETVRDKDGLALSSRNVYLSHEEREKALAIPKSLKRAGKMIASGVSSCEEIADEMQEMMREIGVEYVAFTNRKLEPIEHVVVGESMILVAARVGATRLIDNLWV